MSRRRFNKQGVMAGMLISCLVPFSVHGAIPMNDQQVMEASISNKGLTRLSVKGDIIQDIFVYPFMIGNVVTSESIQLHKSGHIFIAPDGIKEPFYITVITQKGQVQDLKLSPAVQKTAPLVLVLPSPEENPHDVAKESKIVLEKHLLSALQGIPPRGFITGSLEDVPPLDMGDLKGALSAVYTLGRERLAVYTLENTGEKEITLMPDSFLTSCDLAVVFDKVIILPQEKSRLAILSEIQPPSLMPSPRQSLSMEKLSGLTKGKTG